MTNRKGHLSVTAWGVTSCSSVYISVDLTSMYVLLSSPFSIERTCPPEIGDCTFAWDLLRFSPNASFFPIVHSELNTHN